MLQRIVLSHSGSSPEPRRWSIMRVAGRLAMVALLVAVCLAAAMGQGLVPSNDGTPGGITPKSYACYPTCVLPQSIIAADLNVDGWLDLAVACATGPVWMYANQGFVNPGVFAWAPTPVLPAGPISIPPAPWKLVKGQFLAYTNTGVRTLGYDGFTDIAVLDALTGTVTGIPGWPGATPLPPAVGATPGLLAGNPPTFPQVLPLFAPGAQTYDIASGDLDHDARTDFVVVSTTGTILLYTFANAYGTPIVVGIQPAQQVVIADFDGNGWNDIVFSSGGAVGLYLNATPTAGVLPPTFVGPYWVPTTLWGNKIVDMEVGDFNADGLPDVVVVGNAQISNLVQGYAEVLLNNLSIGGSAAFWGSLTSTPFVPQGPMSTWGFQVMDVEVFDADNNGRDDFAVANKLSDTVTVFLTDGIKLGADKRPRDPERCLCDEQVKQDLLIVGFKVFKIELQCGHFPISLAAGDFDNNGKLDLAVALESATTELEAQKPSCIEIDFDIACAFDPANLPQRYHRDILPMPSDVDPNRCPSCCPATTSTEGGTPK
jgi:hypothetical protein